MRATPDELLELGHYTHDDEILHLSELLERGRLDLIAQHAMWLYVRRWDDTVDVSEVRKWLQRKVPGIAELSERCRVE